MYFYLNVFFLCCYHNKRRQIMQIKECYSMNVYYLLRQKRVYFIFLKILWGFPLNRFWCTWITRKPVKIVFIQKKLRKCNEVSEKIPILQVFVLGDRIVWYSFRRNIGNFPLLTDFTAVNNIDFIIIFLKIMGFFFNSNVYEIALLKNKYVIIFFRIITMWVYYSTKTITW